MDTPFVCFLFLNTLFLFDEYQKSSEERIIMSTFEHSRKGNRFEWLSQHTKRIVEVA